MSAYTVIETQLVCPEHIVSALADLGFTEVEVHDSPQALVGWRGDARRNTAEIIIRRTHIGDASNDIGFARNAHGAFTALISQFDRNRFGPRWLGKLTQRYAYHVARERLEAQGFARVEEQAAENDSIRITLRRTA